MLNCVVVFSQKGGQYRLSRFHNLRLLTENWRMKCGSYFLVATNFIQNFPTYGLPASQRTEVRVLYDDDAIYVGAYLYDDPFAHPQTDHCPG